MDWSFDYLQRAATVTRTRARGCATRPAGPCIYDCRHGRWSNRCGGKVLRSTRRHRWRLLAARAGPELRRWSSPIRATVAPEAIAAAADRRRPPRHRCSGGHLRRPTECRLDSRAARPGAGARWRAVAYGTLAGARAGTLHADHGDRWPPGHAVMARSVDGHRVARSASSISARPARFPTCIATSALTLI